MTRFLLALILLLALPVAAQARPGDPDRRFGRQGTVTLKANAADAVGGAVKVISGNRVLAGGSAGGQFVVVRLRPSGSLDSRFGTGGQVVPALPGTLARRRARARRPSATGGSSPPARCGSPDGTTKFVAIRLLPTGEIDPSFGAGFGYVLAGPAGAELDTMTMDRNGNVLLARLAAQRPGSGDADRHPAAARRHRGPGLRLRRHGRRRPARARRRPRHGPAAAHGRHA